eukprot:gnl/TRDRNA2_/TRDRNA2_177946_c0_seq1.p2 gnl/TRDRNA2_/TRDRNA2_177946_c0~~gnl/TRDRNA2_/TRDRNA2_177946_c0_seq1.p2  ORF type:complete len:114 (+),score=3.98 gnl/TRDRNA2_/TRDRNA2_177946_c0_seq1:328-669(+)
MCPASPRQCGADMQMNCCSSPDICAVSASDCMPGTCTKTKLRVFRKLLNQGFQIRSESSKSSRPARMPTECTAQYIGRIARISSLPTDAPLRDQAILMSFTLEPVYLKRQLIE